MTRRVALALLVIALPLSAAPVPKAVKAKAPPMARTRWSGSGGKNAEFEYTFREDGTFKAHHPGDGDTDLVSEGTWKQEGDTLEWEFGRRTSVFTVTFRDGQFEGTGVNRRKETWPVTLKPLEK